MEQDKQVVPYFKDAGIETVLADLNETIAPLESQLITKFDQPRYPVILIAGLPRSGTTLVMQLLIACFDIGYVSNLMARFWRAPYIGAMLFQELRRRKALQTPNFASELGATYGYEGPHEFGSFWQRWFPYNETHQTSPEDLESIDFKLFRRELAAVESVFDAPLAFKNPIGFNLNMDILADTLPTAVFIICHRQPVYIAQSLLLSRLKHYGQKDAWFSVKPKEYAWLKELPYPEQIAAQIYYTERRITESLALIPSHQCLRIEYEDLCKDPMREMGRFRKLVERDGHKLEATGYSPKPFESTDVQRVDDEEFKRLRAALDHFYGGE
jgi:hypothetical protein